MQGLVYAELNSFYRSPTAGDMAKINGLKPAPLRVLKEADVYARQMRLTGDALNAMYGRFRRDDIPGIAQMTIGAPLLVGHQKQQRPVGRFFDGATEELEGVLFTLNKFYWPSARSDSSDLATDIDCGVAAECSISFVFSRPTCGLCGEDIRSWGCPHFPGREYPKTEKHDGGICFYWYDGVEEVLEGSIVYRGAHPKTGFGALMASLSSDAAKDWMAVWGKSGVRRVMLNGVELERRVRGGETGAK